MDTGMEASEYPAVKEAAQKLGLTPATVYRLVAAGNIPALQLCDRGAIRIPRSAVEPQPKEEK
jgi:excisionase family DNA binding protein